VPKREFSIEFKGEGGAVRLDVFLADKVPGLTRSQLKRLIDDGNVRVRGETRRAGYKLRTGDVIEIAYEVREEKGLVPQDLPLKILYRDEDVIVLDKPSGLVVHPGAGHAEGTLANALVYHFPEIATVGPPDRPGIVHRLDQGTSGVMVVARSARAYDSLTRQFRRHEVWKTYLGLAYGRIAAPEGRINWPLGRHVTEGKKISVRSRHPKPAETFFTVLQTFKDATLLEIRPVTGRTHQIRVHLAAAGHPIIGDYLYGRETKGKKAPRLFLHAHTLSFIHPAAGQRLEFASPLPAELESLLADLSGA
jgi:23S rRNA pseudouridine1911/1915/1917 synthase